MQKVIVPPCSGHSRYAVRSRCWCKKSLYPHAVDAVGMQYAVGVGAKRSTHTVDLADMGGRDHYL